MSIGYGGRFAAPVTFIVAFCMWIPAQSVQAVERREGVLGSGGANFLELRAVREKPDQAG